MSLHNEEEKGAAFERVVAELRARQKAGPMTADEWLAFIRQLPPSNDDWSSADIIRELRGPLPADDPEFPHDRR
jgi:hypothetical protein